jgi:hypothetical protein
MAVFYTKGRYRCQITDQALGETDKGTPQFVLRFQVCEYNISGGWEPLEKQYERTAYLYITDKTIEYFRKKLQALGYTHGSLRYLDPGTPGYQNFGGQMADFFCNIEQNQNGEDRERWDLAFGNESEPLELKPVDANKLRQLDVLFGAAAKSTKPAARPATATAPRPQPASRPQAATATATMPPPHPSADVQITDEDIPF